MRRLLALCVVMLFAFGVMAFGAVKNPDTIIVATIGEPSTLDPHYAYDTASGQVIYNVYENLIAYKGSSMSEFVPRLAERWEIKDDGKTYIFYIRKGIKFHNGEELTPEDVEYSFERGLILDPVAGPMWMLWEAIFGVDSLEGLVEKVIGKPYSELFDENGEPLPEYKEALIKIYTDYIDPAIEVDKARNAVVIKLVRPFSAFLSIIAQGGNWGAILCKKWCIEKGCWDGRPDTWWKYHNIKKEDSPLYAETNGTGPFMLETWDRAQQKVILVRNDNYWRGPAKIKRAIIWGIDEWSTRRAMLEKGDADIVAVPPQYISQVEGMKGVEVIKGLPRPVVVALHFNWDVKPDSKYIGSGKLDGEGIPPNFFTDEHVRKAFAYCFNYDEFIKEVLKGNGRRVPAALPAGFLGFSEDLPYLQFDLKKAEEEFKKAWDGKLWKVGFKMTLLYNTGNETRQVAAEMLKYYIESINPKFRIEVRGVQWPTYLDAYKKGYLPAFIIGWLADYPDPHNFIFTYYHSNGVYGGRQGASYRKFVAEKRAELGGMSLNELIEEAAKETDPRIRQIYYEKVQRFAVEHVLGIALYQPYGIRVQRKWVKGWYFHPMRPGDDFYTLYKAEE